MLCVCKMVNMQMRIPMFEQHSNNTTMTLMMTMGDEPNERTSKRLNKRDRAREREKNRNQNKLCFRHLEYIKRCTCNWNTCTHHQIK